MTDTGDEPQDRVLVDPVADVAGPDAAGPQRRARAWFPPALAAVVLGGLVLRVTWVLAWGRHQGLHGDQVFYHHQGRALAEGAGFVNPYAWADTAQRVEIPSALHPPLYSAYLGLVSVLGSSSELSHRLASTLLGAACVLLVALVARRLAGDRAGILAGVLAAVYPNLWINDGLLAAESLYAPLVALVLLLAYRFREAPSPPRAAWLGATIGFAALTRAEAALLFVLLAVPLVLLIRGTDRAARLRMLGACALAGALVLAPWVGRNLVTFGDPVLLSSGAGYVLEISNCDETYRGEMLGYWSVACDRDHTWVHQPVLEPGMSEAVREAAVREAALANARDETANERSKRSEGLAYVRENLDRLPVVVAARVGRLWEVWRPAQGVDLNVFFERRGRLPSRAALAMYYVVLPLAVAGCVVLHRRRTTIVPFVALAAMATLTAAISFGITRYRVGLDVGMVVLAGVSLDAALRRWGPWATREPPGGAPEGELVEASG